LFIEVLASPKQKDIHTLIHNQLSTEQD